MNYTELLEMFVGDDRIEMKKPFVAVGDVESYYVATDGISMIYFDARELYLPFKTNKMSERTVEYIKAIDDCTQKSEISVAVLSEFIVPEMIDEMIEVKDVQECELCEGKGSTEWTCDQYTQEHECPKCDGDGIITTTRKEQTGNKIPNYQAAFMIDGTIFSYYVLDRLLKAAKLVGTETIVHRYFDEPMKQNYFELGHGIVVLTMPLRSDEENIPELNQVEKA